MASKKDTDHKAVNSTATLRTKANKGVMTTTVTNGCGLQTKSLILCRLQKKKIWPTERHDGTVVALRYVPENPKKNLKGEDADHTIVLDLDTFVHSFSWSRTLATELLDSAVNLCQRWNKDNSPMQKAYNRSAKATEFVLAVSFNALCSALGLFYQKSFCRETIGYRTYTLCRRTSG